MISHDELHSLLQEAFPEASIELNDLTGGQDHWEAEITCPTFTGLSQLQRHRKVYAVVAEEMKGPLHALSLKTISPED